MNRETFEYERNMQPFMDKIYQGVVDRSKSCKQFDVIVGDKRIEEKFLFSGHKYDQFLVELVQDAKTGDLGWFYHVDADWLVWCYCPEDHISHPLFVYWVKYKQLKEEVVKLLESADTWQSFNINNQHYGITINFPVKWQPLIDKGIAKVKQYDEPEPKQEQKVLQAVLF